MELLSALASVRDQTAYNEASKRVLSFTPSNFSSSTHDDEPTPTWSSSNGLPTSQIKEKREKGEDKQKKYHQAKKSRINKTKHWKQKKRNQKQNKQAVRKRGKVRPRSMRIGIKLASRLELKIPASPVRSPDENRQPQTNETIRTEDG